MLSETLKEITKMNKVPQNIWQTLTRNNACVISLNSLLIHVVVVLYRPLDKQSSAVKNVERESNVHCKVNFNPLPEDQNFNSHLLPLHISYRSSGEKLLKYQANNLVDIN